MADTLPATPKPVKSKPARALRLAISMLDPRAYLHAAKMLNYYNYTHVTPLRAISTGRGVAISPTVSFSHGERIEIGSRSHIGAHCKLWAGPAHGRIQIGETCLFGPGVFVTAASYRFRDGSPVTRQLMFEAHVIIGRDVWIGANAVILPGTQIGDGAIIGAGAVLRGKIDPGAIVTSPAPTKIGDRFPEDLAA